MRPEFRHKSVITSNATQNRRYGKNPERARTFKHHDTRTLIRANPGTSAGFFFYDVLPPPWRNASTPVFHVEQFFVHRVVTFRAKHAEIRRDGKNPERPLAGVSPNFTSA